MISGISSVKSINSNNATTTTISNCKSELKTSTPQRASAMPMKNMSEYFTQLLSPIKENADHENVQHDHSYSKKM